MAIKTTTNIDVDFYDKKYILVNAKQLDRGAKFLDEDVDFEGNEYSRWLDEGSRFFSVTCYYQGNLITFNSGDHAAYIRYRKPDGYAVYNYCTIDRFGKIIVALTEQMLASEGICVADLVIVKKGEAKVDSDNGEIINMEDTFVLSTMPIHIDVTEAAVNNSEIESSYEFNLLNDRLTEYWANFEKVMKTSQSWAEGGTGIRNGEDTNNSKYWAEQSETSASAASNSADNAATSESNANEYMSNALEYKGAAEQSATAAKQSEDNAFDSKNDASISEHNAKVWATGGYLQAREGETVDTNEIVGTEENARQAIESAIIAQRYAVGGTETVDGEDEDNAKWYWQQSTILADNANDSATAAETSANTAKLYAVGNSDEDTNNARWYYNEIREILNGLNIVFVPKGTISFSELATVKETAIPGYIYNIKDDFVTDDSFREGGGVTYTAGTNVYYVIDENGEYKWDCFGGAASPVADVEDVKDYLGINDTTQNT